MPQARRKEPLIFAIVTAVAMVAAILAWALIGGKTDANAGGPFSSDEQAALDAAQTEVANFNSFRRADFDADYARAQRGLTGQVASDFMARKATYKKVLTDGKFDLAAKITHVALIGKLDNDKVQGYEVLVSFNGYKSTQQNLPTQQNLQVTVVKTSGKWLINDFNSIAVSQ